MVELVAQAVTSGAVLRSGDSVVCSSYKDVSCRGGGEPQFCAGRAYNCGPDALCGRNQGARENCESIGGLRGSGSLSEEEKYGTA